MTLTLPLKLESVLTFQDVFCTCIAMKTSVDLRVAGVLALLMLMEPSGITGTDGMYFKTFPHEIGI